jgi:hypothetical protein
MRNLLRIRQISQGTFCKKNWFCYVLHKAASLGLSGVLHLWRVRCERSVDRCVSPCEIRPRAAIPSLSAPGTVGDVLSASATAGRKFQGTRPATKPTRIMRRTTTVESRLRTNAGPMGDARAGDPGPGPWGSTEKLGQHITHLN